MPHDPYKALYIHLPFCVKKCAYCDFTSKAVKKDSHHIDHYVDDLILQIRQKSHEGELSQIETVYLGGGTPSYIGSKRLSSLLYALSHFMRLEPDVECSMEANPESITPELINDIWALGVNRLSIGVQSFDDTVLQTLGRAHDSEQAKRAISYALNRFENVSLDLMCGIPGQTTASFVSSVQQAVDLGVSHVSVYPLTIEEHTLFYKMLLKGQLPEPDEDIQAEQMEAAASILTQAGFARYEVASYAKPGFECKHNISYWTGVPYLGLGLSAATMTQNSQRRMRVKDGQVTDDLLPAQMLAEDLMLSMRMARGVSEQQVISAKNLLPQVESTFEELCELGLVERKAGRLCPTQTGWLCGNELYGRIFDLA